MLGNGKQGGRQTTNRKRRKRIVKGGLVREEGEVTN